MLRFRPSTPNRNSITIKGTTVEHALEIKYSLKKAKSSLFWGLINIILLGFVIYDLAYKCPLYTTTFNYIEYCLAVIFTLNILYHLVRYFVLIVTSESVSATPSDKRFLDVGKENTNKLNTASTSTTCIGNLRTKSSENFSELSPFIAINKMNNSALSWRTDSQNESHNYSMPSPSWVFYRGSPDEQKAKMTPSRHSLVVDDTLSDGEYITDEKMLQRYLYDFDIQDKAQNANNTLDSQSNLLSSYWTHPGNQTQHDTMYLRKVQYQLAQASPSTTTTNPAGTKDEGSPLNISQKGNDVWKKLQVEPQILTQWNANLRMWISQTILDRLINEIDSINIDFMNHHIPDVQIGLVGLERLRKTAQTIQAQEYVPTLGALLPFLEITQNQEYLVKRFRELSKGGCMSEYKWSGGGSYNGKEWDDSLPTDSAIIMHVLSTYLDSQLLPLPNKPDAKPFSKEHYVKLNEKLVSSPDTLAINHASDKPPHYRLIVGEEIYEVAKGHNNLFHTILLFLYYVNKKEHGMLGKVNMGKSGVNMLWIIDNYDIH